MLEDSNKLELIAALFGVLMGFFVLSRISLLDPLASVLEISELERVMADDLVLHDVTHVDAADKIRAVRRLTVPPGDLGSTTAAVLSLGFSALRLSVFSLTPRCIEKSHPCPDSVSGNDNKQLSTK